MPKGIYQHKTLTEEHKENIRKGVKNNLPKTIFKKGYHPSTEFKKGVYQGFGFQKGYAPWNKGKKGGTPGSFQKGHPVLKEWGFQKGHKINNGRKASEKARQKMREAQSGEKNHRWIKDRESVKRNLRNDPAYLQWVRQVKKRDRWKCKINNKDCSGYCEVHHILSWKDYPELRYKINNGITLCQAHHPRKRAEEKRLIPFFQGLVPVSNEVI